ncbi:MAG TPA: S28 family serine protease [Saprospiraceae bacterium]|nr:S28 family serine protease [Saprospiraceae bacterium]
MRILLLLVWALNIPGASAQGKRDETRITGFLSQQLPGIQIKTLEPRDGFELCMELIIPQYLDHGNTALGVFPQTVLLYHRSFKKPNVLVTEGYHLGDRMAEATLILDANQISVEHRFFGDSRPEQIDWQLLNHRQAMSDLHRIRKVLGGLYKKSWVATGVSKGGTLSAVYSLSYPDDVDATVSYVAPFVLEQEDPRTIEHYNRSVSTPECRAKVRHFQRAMLGQRTALKALLAELEKRDQVRFMLDLDKVIDFAAMEYPFSFWQWGFGCPEIPAATAGAQEIFEHIEAVVDFNYYDSLTCAQFLPAYYQFMTEFGYYGFDTTGIGDLLVYKHLTNLEFCPKDADLRYDGSFMRAMHDKAVRESRNTIYIYGGLDTWTACAIQPSSETNAIKMVKYDGGHRTRLRDFAEGDRQRAYKALRKWTKHKTKPLPY